MAKKSNLVSVKPKKVMMEVGNRQLEFVLDLNAFSEIEDKYGNLQELMYKVESGSMKAVRAVLWAGLQSNENPPTEKEVGANIKIHELENYMKIIVEGMGIALPEADEATDPN